MLVSLNNINIAQKAIIVAIKGDSSLKKHLNDIGLITGKNIEVLHKSSSCMIKTGSTKIALSTHIMQNIKVQAV